MTLESQSFCNSPESLQNIAFPAHFLNPITSTNMSSSSFITNSSHRHLFNHYSCLAAEHHKLSSSLPDIVKDIAFKHSSNCRCSLQRSSSSSLSSHSPPPSLPAITSSDQDLLLEVGQSLMRISESFQQTRNSQKICVIIDVKVPAFSFSVKMVSFDCCCPRVSVRKSHLDEDADSPLFPAVRTS